MRAFVWKPADFARPNFTSQLYGCKHARGIRSCILCVSGSRGAIQTSRILSLGATRWTFRLFSIVSTHLLYTAAPWLKVSSSLTCIQQTGITGGLLGVIRSRPHTWQAQIFMNDVWPFTDLASGMHSAAQSCRFVRGRPPQGGLQVGDLHGWSRPRNSSSLG